jgi:FADH2 O2-dependent halogenase
VHHVFDGGWMWVLRFNNGIASAGVALTDRVARDLRAGDGTAAWQRVLTMLPSVGDRFADARAVHPFVHAPRLAFRSREVCGRRWALLPSTAGVIDPLLSTGFPLTLLGILRLLDVLERTVDGPERETALRAYAAATHNELDVTEQLVAALYAQMGDPPLFKRLALLYFAAASYAETARRIGRPDLAPGFLLHAHATFGPELRACTQLAHKVSTGHGRASLVARIDRAIEPFDVAGLGDRSRRDWYPVLASDLVAGASKLHASAAQVDRLLERSGFASQKSG